MPGRPSPSIQRTAGGVTVGINVGIAEVGITTDYGGGGKIGFGGQSVTWGLEGGKIQMGIAGFELIVEARNCVVTEIKKIAGQVVSTRTYPDPGCKQPEAPKPPEQKQPEINPDNLQPLIPVGMDEQKFAYVFLNVYRKMFSVFGALPINGTMTPVNYTISTAKTNIKKGVLPSIIPSYSGGFFPSFASSQAESEDDAENTYFYTWRTYGGVSVSLGDFVQNYRPAFARGKVRKKISSYSYSNIFRPGFPTITVQTLNSRVETLESISTQGGGIWPPNSSNLVVDSTFVSFVDSMVVWGRLDVVKAWIVELNSRPTSINNGLGYRYEQIIVSEIIYPGNHQQKPLEGGNRPPMNSSCCKEILADLEDIKEVFAVKEMLKGECTFPWRLRMPGGKGEEKITDYANYLRALAQEIDHLGLHPPRLYIQDNNNAQEGDQTVDIKFPSATSAFEALMRQVWDDNADGDTRTNFLYRLAWLSVQNQEMCLRTIAIVKAIAHGLGIETEVDTDKIPIPFNITAGIKKNATRGQGFGKGSNPKPQIDNRIDLNTEIATEALLPEFLQCRENEVLIETFSGDLALKDILVMILMHVEKLNSK